jgi:hypothetical protein
MDTHRSLAASLVAAPVLWLAAEGFSPALKSDTGEQLAVVAAHGDRWYAYTLFLLLGSIVFIPGIVGLAVVARRSRAATVATALMGYGMVIACTDVMTQFTVWKAATADADRTQMVQLFARVDDSAGVGLLYATGGLGFLIGAVIMAVALVRTPDVPAWSGLAFGAAMVLQLVGFTISSVVVIAASALLALIAVIPPARVLADSGDRRVLTPQHA